MIVKGMMVFLYFAVQRNAGHRLCELNGSNSLGFVRIAPRMSLAVFLLFAIQRTSMLCTTVWIKR